MGNRGPFLGPEADHSHPSSAEVKSAWSCNSTPQYVFMAWCSVKKRHRDKFTFVFTHHQILIGRMWVDNIRVDLKEIGWKGVNWIHLAQEGEQWRAVVNTVTDFRVQ
jgi:hypothetical protein